MIPSMRCYYHDGIFDEQGPFYSANMSYGIKPLGERCHKITLLVENYAWGNSILNTSTLAEHI